LLVFIAVVSDRHTASQTWPIADHRRFHIRTLLLPARTSLVDRKTFVPIPHLITCAI
jgi:hypothetical protein